MANLSKSRLRANKVSFGIEDMFKNERENKIAEREKVVNESYNNQSKNYSENTFIKRKDKKFVLEDCYNIKKSMLSEAFADIVLTAVPIDEDKKPLLENYILDLSKVVYEKLMSEDKLLVGCDEYNEYLYPFVESFPMVTECIKNGNKKELKRILENIDLDRDTLLRNEMANKINKKVKNVLISEQIEAKKRNDVNVTLSKRERNYRSLFESINILTYKNLKKGKTNTLNESTDCNTVKYKFESLEEEALARTVIYSTILESLNTLNLCKFTKNDIEDDALNLIRMSDRK